MVISKQLKILLFVLIALLVLTGGVFLGGLIKQKYDQHIKQALIKNPIKNEISIKQKYIEMLQKSPTKGVFESIDNEKSIINISSYDSAAKGNKIISFMITDQTIFSMEYEKYSAEKIISRQKLLEKKGKMASIYFSYPENKKEGDMATAELVTFSDPKENYKFYPPSFKN